MNEIQDETYLDMAKRNLRAARRLIDVAEDEGDLNIVAYHVQQAVELSLKHHIEVNMGENYPYTHDIGDLVHIAGEDNFPDLYPWSGTITLMESKTRYIKNYRLSRRVINDTMDIASKTIDKIEILGHSEEIEETNKLGINENNKESWKPRGR